MQESDADGVFWLDVSRRWVTSGLSVVTGECGEASATLCCGAEPGDYSGAVVQIIYAVADRLRVGADSRTRLAVRADGALWMAPALLSSLRCGAMAPLKRRP